MSGDIARCSSTRVASAGLPGLTGTAPGLWQERTLLRHVESVDRAGGIDNDHQFIHGAEIKAG